MKKLIRMVCIGMTVLMLLMSMNFVVFAEDEETTEETTTETTTDESTSEGAEQTVTKPNIAKGMVAHWEFEGNLNDSTAFKNNGVAITASKGISYTDGIFGKAVKFDGKSYIEVKDSDSLDLNNGFTISLWAFKEDTRPNGLPYLEKLGDTKDDYASYTVREWWYNQPDITLSASDGSNTDIKGQVTDIQKWNLITFTFDGKEVKIYNNGVLVTSDMYEYELLTSKGKIRIGNSIIAMTNCFYKGLMDDIRIYNYAIEYDEVKGLYDSGLKGKSKDLINPPAKKVAHYKFDGDLKDCSGFSNNGKAGKGTITYMDGIAGKAAMFNGATYVEVADSNSLDIDKAFTIEAWMYAEKGKTTFKPLLNKYGATTGHSTDEKKNPSYSLSAEDHGFEFFGYGFGTDVDDLTLNSTPSDEDITIKDNTWYHIAYTYDGSKLISYVNGVLTNTLDCDKVLGHSSEKMRIGSTMDKFFNGALDELKIYNYALDAKKVEQEYKLKDTVTLDAASTAALGKMKVGGTAKIKIIRKDAYNPKAASVDCSATAKYSSSNPKVFTVSGGVVKAVGKGTANLTIVSGALSTNVKVTVK